MCDCDFWLDWTSCTASSLNSLVYVFCSFCMTLALLCEALSFEFTPSTKVGHSQVRIQLVGFLRPSPRISCRFSREVSFTALSAHLLLFKIILRPQKLVAKKHKPKRL